LGEECGRGKRGYKVWERCDGKRWRGEEQGWECGGGRKRGEGGGEGRGRARDGGPLTPLEGL